MKKVVFGIAFLFCVNFIYSENQKDTSLTVYNQDLGVVSQKMKLTVKPGKSEIKMTDVAARIDATSVHFKSLKEADKLAVLEQNYQFDLVSTSQLLWRYIDQDIKVYAAAGKVYQGKLLSYDGATLLLDNGGSLTSVRLTESVQNIEFPSLPEGLITRPTLVWLMDNRGSQAQECELSYMTGGISWHAEYVALLDEEEKNINLGAWVSLDNRSGATYEDAKLKLIAGDVNRVQPPRMDYRFAMKAAASEAVGNEPQFQEKGFFEYHLYTLQRRATIRDKEIKQVSLFPNTDAGVKKIYTYDSYLEGNKVRVNVEFKNEKKNVLGIAMPAGKVRVYKKDSDGSQEFIGEDWIDHTPKDEKIRLFLGNAFDIVAERNQKNYRQINNRRAEYTFEIKLRNHKKEDVQIIVVEHLNGDWTITSNSQEYVKKNATTVEFTVPVAKDGESVLTYTYYYKW